MIYSVQPAEKNQVKLIKSSLSFCFDIIFENFPVQTPKRNHPRYDFVSPSLTASTSASRSKMNRAASICNINEHYDSFTSLNSKATMPIIKTARPTSLFGGSLMNIPIMNNYSTQKQSQQRAFNLLDDSFDLTAESPLSGSLSSLAFSTTGGKLC